jgi:hypothetical protein
LPTQVLAEKKAQPLALGGTLHYYLPTHLWGAIDAPVAAVKKVFATFDYVFISPQCPCKDFGITGADRE